jgi:glucoamylase
MTSIEAFANDGGLIPEQIWDAPDIADQKLLFGRPSGSAIPLVWAHAEYIKLRRSLHNDRVFDLPPQTVKRYLTNKTGSAYNVWRFNNKCDSMPLGKILRIELLSSASIRWSTDGWRTARDTQTQE